MSSIVSVDVVTVGKIPEGKVVARGWSYPLLRGHVNPLFLRLPGYLFG